MAPVQLENHQLVPPGGGGGGSGGPASAPAPAPPGAAVAAAAAAAASPGYRLSTLIEFLLHRAYSELMVLTDLGCCFLLSAGLLSLQFQNSWGSAEVEEKLGIWDLAGEAPGTC